MKPFVRKGSDSGKIIMEVIGENGEKVAEYMDTPERKLRNFEKPYHKVYD